MVGVYGWVGWGGKGLGCMLYQCSYGRLPFGDPSLYQKLSAIPNPAHAIPFPPLRNLDLLAVLKACLSRDPAARPPIAGPGGLLTSAFLRPAYRGGGGGDDALYDKENGRVGAVVKPALSS